VINRRHSYLDRDPHRFPRAGIKPKPRSVLTGRSISGTNVFTLRLPKGSLSALFRLAVILKRTGQVR
jgi:hypothetical protein